MAPPKKSTNPQPSGAGNAGSPPKLVRAGRVKQSQSSPASPPTAPAIPPPGQVFTPGGKSSPLASGQTPSGASTPSPSKAQARAQARAQKQAQIQAQAQNRKQRRAQHLGKLTGNQNRQGIQHILPNEQIIGTMEPKVPDPPWMVGYKLVMFGILLLAVVPNLMVLINPIPYWYIYIIIAIIAEHLVIAAKKKIPEIGEYVIFLTNFRVIIQRIDKKQRVLSERDLPRKHLNDFLVDEVGQKVKRRRAGDAVIFYGLLLLTLPLQIWQTILEWFAMGSWMELIGLAVYLIVALVFIFYYFSKDLGLQVSRDFALHGYAAEYKPIQSPFFGKVLNKDAVLDYGRIFGNISNEVQKSKINPVRLGPEQFLAKNHVDLNQEEFFECGINYGKENLQRPLRSFLKIPAFDIGFFVVSLVFLWLYHASAVPFGIYARYVLIGIIAVLMGKFIIFFGSLTKFSLNMMSDEIPSLLGVTPLVKPKYQSFTTFIRVLGLSVVLFYYITGETMEFLWMAVGISAYFIGSYLLGGFIFGIICMILNFKTEDLYTSVHFSGLEILYHYFKEHNITITLGNQIQTITFYFNRMKMAYNRPLSYSRFRIDGSFNSSFQQIMRNEQLIYYFGFIVVLFVLGLGMPEIFTTWATDFAALAMTLRQTIELLIMSPGALSWFDYSAIGVLLMQGLFIVCFAQILRHLVLMREPNMRFESPKYEPLILRNSSIGESIEVSWTVREIIAKGKVLNCSRAENYLKELKKLGKAASKPITPSPQPSSTPISSPPASGNAPAIINPSVGPSSGSVSGQGLRPAPLSVNSALQKGAASPDGMPAPQPLAFASPYAVPQPEGTNPTKVFSSENISPAPPNSNQVKPKVVPKEIKESPSRNEELKAGTEFVATGRVNIYGKPLDLKKNANYYLFQIDQHQKDIETEIAWENDDPLAELTRFSGLTIEQKNRLETYLASQPSEIQQRIIHILHYLFHVNAKF
jgi:hypothetical protein